jgi:hypothetical protein
MDLDAVFMLGFVVLGIYKVFELFVKKNERIALIEKMSAVFNANEVDKVIKFPEISFAKRGYESWALRIALLLVGIGLGCLLAFCVQFCLFIESKVHLDNWEYRNVLFVLYFSFITMCGGLSLFIAYLIEKQQLKKQKDSAE